MGGGSLLFMLFVSSGGEIRQMRIVQLQLFALIPCIWGSRGRKGGTFKKLS
jgi:hypothetical protein